MRSQGINHLREERKVNEKRENLEQTDQLDLLGLNFHLRLISETFEHSEYSLRKRD